MPVGDRGLCVACGRSQGEPAADRPPPPPVTKCETCKRVYPIKDDIPVMLIDEATIEP